MQWRDIQLFGTGILNWKRNISLESNIHFRQIVVTFYTKLQFLFRFDVTMNWSESLKQYCKEDKNDYRESIWEI